MGRRADLVISPRFAWSKYLGTLTPRDIAAVLRMMCACAENGSEGIVYGHMWRVYLCSRSTFGRLVDAGVLEPVEGHRYEPAYRLTFWGELAGLTNIREDHPHSAAMKRLVYLIRSGPDGPVKIGSAAAPTVRLAELQTAHHQPLELLATAPGGVQFERSLHEELSAHRTHGEWFALPDQVLTELVGRFARLSTAEGE